MVFFSCNACGESLKKANVEKHYLTKCRACEVLSCLDCGKDFYGDGYREHTSCISEDQKYGGKNFKATPHKGAVKQNSWIEVVRGASMNPSLNPKVRSTFKTIINCGQDNIPRKKAKFMNFVKNSVHVRESWVIEQVWKTIETYSAAQKKESDESAAPKDGVANGNIQTMEKSQNGGEELEMKQQIEEKTSSEDSKGDKRERSDRKRKRQGDPLDEAGGDGEKTSEEQQPKKKKKKKKRKDNGEDGGVCNGDNDDSLDKPSESLRGELDKSKHSIQNNNSEPSAEQEGDKKKRKKKQKREANGEPLKTLGLEHNQLERTLSQEDVNDRQTEMSRSDQRKKGKKQREKKEEKENGLEVDAADDGIVDVAADEVVPSNKGGKFRWEDVITQVLTNAGGEIRLKKLKKKVFSEYFAQGGDGSITSEEKLFIKFNKKVMKNPKFKVHKEMVQLKH